MAYANRVDQDQEQTALFVISQIISRKLHKKQNLGPKSVE